MARALRELQEQGGWQGRRQHYRALSGLVREGLREQGVRTLLEPACYSATLTSFLLPEGVRFMDLYERLKQAGFVIYPGQSAVQEAIFRIAIMGDLSQKDMTEFLGAFRAARADAAAPLRGGV